jgi:hypothetical protein
LPRFENCIRSVRPYCPCLHSSLYSRVGQLDVLREPYFITQLKQDPHINNIKYRFLVQCLLLTVHPTKRFNFNSAGNLLSSESLSKCRSGQPRGHLHSINITLHANNASSTSDKREQHAARKPRRVSVVVRNAYQS